MTRALRMTLCTHVYALQKKGPSVEPFLLLAADGTNAEERLGVSSPRLLDLRMHKSYSVAIGEHSSHHSAPPSLGGGAASSSVGTDIWAASAATITNRDDDSDDVDSSGSGLDAGARLSSITRVSYAVHPPAAHARWSAAADTAAVGGRSTAAAAAARMAARGARNTATQYFDAVQGIYRKRFGGHNTFQHGAACHAVSEPGTQTVLTSNAAEMLLWQPNGTGKLALSVLAAECSSVSDGDCRLTTPPAFMCDGKVVVAGLSDGHVHAWPTAALPDDVNSKITNAVESFASVEVCTSGAVCALAANKESTAILVATDIGGIFAATAWSHDDCV